MAIPKFATKSVDPIAADIVYVELARFVESRSPGVVDKKPDTAVDFKHYLKTLDLKETNILNEGKRLAVEFLDIEDARLERSFVMLYCVRQTRKKNTGLGRVIIFLALGPLSCANGLPKFENGPGKDLASGDALLVGNDTPHMLDTNRGGGFALMSDWTA
ncbi:hypothetical protein G7Y89_g7324 [Cudoniella acicularis]|uniref:Uncharacterized protein n=1 Tax=Cudoniella acicularis TaxID=354080 RepID=A0A8H4RKP5_9HELO|nr:hypothetical protein G7Y89_g7324 [Cudoniella acicularis]